MFSKWAQLYRVALRATESDPASFPAMCVSLWDDEPEDTIEGLMALHVACAPEPRAEAGLLSCLVAEEAGSGAKLSSAPSGAATSGSGGDVGHARPAPADHRPTYDDRIARAVLQFGGQVRGAAGPAIPDSRLTRILTPPRPFPCPRGLGTFRS